MCVFVGKFCEAVHCIIESCLLTVARRSLMSCDKGGLYSRWYLRTNG